MSIKAFLAVASGGAVGTWLRYMISLIPFKGNFPIATFLVNVLGAFALGLISGFVIDKDISREWELFLKTGMCGGFTTFSTFSLESILLLENGKIGFGVLCIIAGLFGSLISVSLGLYLGRTLG